MPFDVKNPADVALIKDAAAIACKSCVFRASRAPVDLMSWAHVIEALNVHEVFSEKTANEVNEGDKDTGLGVLLDAELAAVDGYTEVGARGIGLRYQIRLLHTHLHGAV